MRLQIPADPSDPDPWPRPAPVGPGSAHASVTEAVTAPVLAVREGGTVQDAGERVALRTWWFDSDASRESLSAIRGAGRPVSIPDCWSRRDPALMNHPGPVVYGREVTAPGPHARLVLHGLDYVARITVDGETAAVHEGAFAPVAVELPSDRTCEVVVWLDDPIEDHRLTPEPGLKMTRKIKGVQEDHDSRPGGMAYGPHWDPQKWVGRWGSGGMTGDAVMHSSGPLRLEAVFVTAQAGSLRLSWVVRNLGSATHAKIVFSVGDQTFTVGTRLEPGSNRVSIRLDSSDEMRWAPEEPNLYELRSTVRPGGGEPSDSARTTFGVRKVGMDMHGPEELQLRLDGQRVYVRAANYIPGVWPSELRPDTILRDVELAKAAHLNSLGVHASVTPALFDVADRAGLLVYQDFPLQQAYDATGGPLVQGGPGYAEASLFLAAEMVYSYYNHPSIVYWCGHNEPAYQFMPPEGLLDTLDPKSVFAEMVRNLRALPDETELDLGRAELLRTVDPSRPTNDASGLGARRDHGDVHDYSGSLAGGHPTDSSAGRTRFVSEFGAWSVNFSGAGRAASARGDWPPPPEADREWHEHTHLEVVQQTYAGRPDRFEDFQTWCLTGQLWAGWHAKAIIEQARLAKWSPSAAHRWHFFVDHWGAAGAGVVDRERTTGPAYRGLAFANRPIMPACRMPAGGRVVPGAEVVLAVSVINDAPVDLGDLEVKWRIAALGTDDAFVIGRDDWYAADDPLMKPSPADHCAVLPRREGQTLAHGALSGAVGPDQVAPIGEVRWTADVTGPVALFLDLGGLENWTSFVVAPDGWMPTPGLVGPRRFTVSGPGALTGARSGEQVDEHPPPAQLRRRWTGEPVDPTDAPADQYLLGNSRVDVYDDVQIDAGGRVITPPLPWPDPLNL